MKNITLSVPEELHKKLKNHNEVKWSQVIRDILRKKVKELEEMEKILSKSELTSEDAKEISDKIDDSVAKKLGLK